MPTVLHRVRWHLTIHGVLSALFGVSLLLWTNITHRTVLLLIAAYLLGGLVATLASLYYPPHHKATAGHVSG